MLGQLDMFHQGIPVKGPEHIDKNAATLVAQTMSQICLLKTLFLSTTTWGYFFPFDDSAVGIRGEGLKDRDATET